MNMTIACVLSWGIALVGVFSIGRGSPYMGNISGARQTLEDGAHLRPQLCRKPDCGFDSCFVKYIGTNQF